MDLVVRERNSQGWHQGNERVVSQARPFTNRREERKCLVKLHRHFCSHYAMKIVVDMRGVTSLCPGLVAIATAAIELLAFLSSAGKIVKLHHRVRSIRNY